MVLRVIKPQFFNNDLGGHRQVRRMDSDGSCLGGMFFIKPRSWMGPQGCSSITCSDSPMRFKLVLDTLVLPSGKSLKDVRLIIVKAMI